MKKVLSVLSIIAVVIIFVCFLSGCNQQIFDTTYKFDRAIISMPDGSVISGKVESWKDYSDSDAIQVKIDGKTYYTFLDNVVLISND